MTMRRIIQAIKKHKRFIISTHVNPDPDALCSELALAIALKQFGKKVVIVNQDPVPKRYHFLDGMSRIRSYSARSRVSYDAAIIVDCGDLNRIGKVQAILREDKTLINIDHHVTNDYFGDLNLVDEKSSSTTEVLYELLVKAGAEITRPLALHLYTGIMTDTGSFRYENTSPRTHAVTAKLLEHKISPPKLYRQLYETISFRDLAALSDVIGGFDLCFQGKVVCVDLQKKVLSKFSGEFDLRDTIFKFLRLIKNTEVFLIFTEVGRRQTRVNLRSSGRCDVAKLAGHFQGGGHRQASGCMIDADLAQARKVVLQRLRKEL